MVFQDHRLLPWLKIKDNVGFGLGDLPKQERDEKVRKHLERVGLANNPTILLLDEPFGALDAYTDVAGLLCSEYPTEKNLSQDENHVAKIKALLDAIKSLQHFVKPLL